MDITHAITGEVLKLLDSMLNSIQEARAGHLARPDFSSDIRILSERIKKIVPDIVLAGSPGRSSPKNCGLHDWLDALVTLAAVPETEQPVSQTAGIVGQLFGEMGMMLRVTRSIEEDLEISAEHDHNHLWMTPISKSSIVAA